MSRGCRGRADLGHRPALYPSSSGCGALCRVSLLCLAPLHRSQSMAEEPSSPSGPAPASTAMTQTLVKKPADAITASLPVLPVPSALAEGAETQTHPPTHPVLGHGRSLTPPAPSHPHVLPALSPPGSSPSPQTLGSVPPVPPPRAHNPWDTALTPNPAAALSQGSQLLPGLSPRSLHRPSSCCPSPHGGLMLWQVSPRDLSKPLSPTC